MMHPFNFEDEEILEQYISLIKGLSVRITLETVQFHISHGSCPLFIQSAKFYNYPESMIRIAGRTAALSIMKIKD